MNSATKHPSTKEKSKSVIVSHLKTQATHGLYGFTKEKYKSVIVSHLKTQAIYGLYGFTKVRLKV
ncbi:hypothetical protein BSPWISOXPB_3527 [uncultured Gammaproteobacteria bacterium]|nr:hypothetical protein BSPWISOXPB_3527 [uncultured Gammaproteobacteria bacterium]